MSVSRVVLAVAVGFLCLFPANALFHVGPGAAYFDARLGPSVASARPMREGNPAFAVVIDLLIAGAMVAFTRHGLVASRAARDGAWVGALLNLVSSATWNLANHITVRGWPVSVTLADVPWHVLLGAVAGLAVGKVLARGLLPAKLVGATSPAAQ